MHRSPELVSSNEGYRLWASTYDTTRSPLHLLEEHVLSRWVQDFRRGVALDVGCGTGRLMRWLRARGFESVVGVDRSHEMLQVAVDTDCVVVNGDAIRLPIASHSVDVACSSFTLNHVRDLQLAAAEMARCVRTGGTIYVAEYHPIATEHNWTRSFKSDDQTVSIHLFPHRTEDYIEAFQSVGFSLVRMAEPKVGLELLAINDPRVPAFVDRFAGVPLILMMMFQCAKT
ncbi:MAG: class I SAM-dependent methyltransferase [Planctomycetota bacterium]|nr:class I SAM-dependent methyltransferase [Planctomycetota bacterium]